MLLVVPLALRRLERPLALPPLLARQRGRLMRLVLGPRRRGLDGVYLLTRRELYAPQPRPLCYRFRLVTVVVVTKSRSPKVGSPTLGSVVVRRTAGAGYPQTTLVFLLTEDYTHCR